LGVLINKQIEKTREKEGAEVEKIEEREDKEQERKGYSKSELLSRANQIERKRS